MKKPKVCQGCGRQRPIWKNHQGFRYCQSCARRLGGSSSLSASSPRRQVQQKTYRQRRVSFLARYPVCQAQLPGCGGRATEVHHIRGRSEEMLTDERYFLAVCRPCHHLIETNPDLSRELGFSASRLTPSEDQ